MTPEIVCDRGSVVQARFHVTLECLKGDHLVLVLDMSTFGEDDSRGRLGLVIGTRHMVQVRLYCVRWLAYLCQN
jgi:hypothetical protein